MKVLQLLLVLTALYEIGLAVPVPGPQLILPLRQHQPFFQRPNRPLLRPGGILSGLFGQQQQAVPATPAAAGVAAPPKTPDAVVTTPAAAPVVSPTGEVAAVPDAGSAPKNPGSLFTPGGSMGGSNTDINGLLGMLNGGQFGSATAGGAGNGAVQDGAAVGQGTGIANVGPGGFGIGLGIGGAIATPLGNLAFGQGDSKDA
uniref:Uncharacterized protein n=1 Tax=Daphnia galeata TaxID=27404 RepID=A0A8J2WQV0_9CRUS|nr:unnamed protein product [Daphnia galeata]